MRNEVKTVKPLRGHRILVELEASPCGVVDLPPYLNHGVFSESRDTVCFNRVGVRIGSVAWPRQQDITPETLLAGLTPVPDEATWN